MSRTIRRNRKPRRHPVSATHGRTLPIVPAVCPDGKVEQSQSVEATDERRISVRRWKLACKAAIERGDDPPPNPRTQGWLTW